MDMFFRFAIVFYIIFLNLTTHILANEQQSLRILHVPSYHMSWEWNSSQLQGFKDGLSLSNVEYKIVELDTKRINDPTLIQQKAMIAKNLIDQWQPDLLYTNDDNAQKYVAMDYVNTTLPIVFSAVNRDPSIYHFSNSSNVTGVMEYEHFIPAINLLRTIKKDIKHIAVIVDSDPMWAGVVKRIKEKIKEVPDIEVTQWYVADTFTNYKDVMKSLQTKVDAVALLGVFNIKDESNRNIDFKEILRWTAENSKLPDFSFWESRVDSGTLVAVAISAYQQGYIAGEMARKILIDGVAPSDIPINSTEKGEPMISLARAKALGMNIDVQILLNIKTKKQYDWSE